MAKDYAKKQRTTVKQRNQRSVMSRVVVAFGFLIICAGLLFTATRYPHLIHPKHSHHKRIHHKHKKLVHKPKQTPRFEFYNILPKVRVEQPSLSKKIESKEPQVYVLQIASFKDFHEADRLKAKLTLLGFDIHVKKIQHNNDDWYRVLVGPFTSSELARSAKARLPSEYHTAFMRKLAA